MVKTSSYFQQLLFLEDKDFVYIENCDNIVLEFTQNLKHKIKYLHVIDSQNVTLMFSKNVLENIENLVLFQSSIFSNLEINSRRTNVFLESSKFIGSFKYFS